MSSRLQVGLLEAEGVQLDSESSDIFMFITSISSRVFVRFFFFFLRFFLFSVERLVSGTSKEKDLGSLLFLNNTGSFFFFFFLLFVVNFSSQTVFVARRSCFRVVVVFSIRRWYLCDLTYSFCIQFHNFSHVRSSTFAVRRCSD